MTKPIRLAVLFDQQVHVGGGYQQALNAALLVKNLPLDLVEPIYFTTLRENLETLKKFGLDAQLLELNIINRLFIHLRYWCENLFIIKIFRFIQNINQFESFFIKNNIDLVYFLSPNRYAKSLEKINYITTVWDLCHRDEPEFPEVRWDRQFEAREADYNAILPRAIAVLVDSDLGKQNVVRRYGIDLDRVHVMPFEASRSSRTSDKNKCRVYDIRAKYNLNFPYIFYPAQFWAHKNHVYLLEGLKELEEGYGVKLGAIFCGSDRGNKIYVEQYAQHLALLERVRFAGFVPDDEMTYLYKQSVALVMPSYFGPTNLPPLEAFELGVPILYSDKSGLREQVEGVGLLMDLKNPSTMSGHLFRLLSEPSLRKQLIESGQQKVARLNKIDRSKILQSILEDFRWKRLTWK
jgi:glycosyltransferase involved in cell wall biosynthesis